MSFQIEKIVLFSVSGKVRELPLRVGAINIISGDSGTGKTSLLRALDYCLGAKECRVPRELQKLISWYGAVLDFSQYRLFVARAAPEAGFSSSEGFCLKVQDSAELPSFSELTRTHSSDGFKRALSGHIGITENLTEVEEGRTSRQIQAGLRHALTYCFQHQNEIASDEFILHGAGNTFKRIDLRDTLPYFLGAMGDDRLRKLNQLTRLKQKLRNAQRKLREQSGGDKNTTMLGYRLISEAIEVGLLEPLGTDLAANFDFEEGFNSLLSRLKCVAEYQPSSIQEAELPTYPELRRQEENRRQIIARLQEIQAKLDEYRTFANEQDAYRCVVQEERARLQSVALYPSDDDTCPLCGYECGAAFPKIEDIKQSLALVQKKLANVNYERPHLIRAIDSLESQQQDYKLLMSENRRALQVLREQHETLRNTGELDTLRAKVTGRISLFLEEHSPSKTVGTLKAEVRQLKEVVNEMEEELKLEEVHSKAESQLNVVGNWIRQWATDLQLEHCDNLLRFDRKSLLVVADTINGPLTLRQMGSAHNWLGYHVVTYLALQKFFTLNNRPIPRFIFLDQLTTPYYSNVTEDSSKELSVDDQLSVERLFRLIFEVVGTMAGKLQVIITEKAAFSSYEFDDSIMAEWRKDGEKLIPTEWFDQVADPAEEKQT